MAASFQHLGHDLRETGYDLEPPLPYFLRAVPAAFFGSVAMTLVIVGLTSYLSKITQDRILKTTTAIAAAEKEMEDLATEKLVLMRNCQRAQILASWIDESPLYQPVLVDVLSTLEPRMTLSRMSLSLDPQNPRQLKLTLLANGNVNETSRQFQLTANNLKTLGYVVLDQQRQASRDATTLSFTLLPRQGRRAPAPQPAPAPPQPASPQ